MTKIWKDNNMINITEGIDKSNIIYDAQILYSIYEDSYEEGEGNLVTSWDDSLKGNILSEVLEKSVSSAFGEEYNPENWLFWTENGYPEFMTDVQVNTDYEVPSSKEYEEWKKGKLDLYIAHVSVKVNKYISSNDTLKEEAERLDIEIEE